MIRRLIEAFIKKFLCCHEWVLDRSVHVSTDTGGVYYIYHYFCKKCGKYKRVRSN